MSKGFRRYAEDEKSKVVDEYLAGEKTVGEICFEHGISRRALYNWVEQKGEGRNRYRVDVHRAGIFLSRDEVELVLLMLLECRDITEKDQYRALAHGLETRLLDMADYMTEIEASRRV